MVYQFKDRKPIWKKEGQFMFLPQEIPDVPIEPLIKLVTREEWGALPPKSTEALTIPVDHVRYNQTNTEICMRNDDCFPLLQKLQKIHMEEKGLPDIQYHFMIAGDGTVYEGRGWHNKGEVHSALKGKQYYDVAYVGTFGKQGPNWEQSVAGQRFLRFAIQNNDLINRHGVTHLCEIAD